MAELLPANAARRPVRGMLAAVLVLAAAFLALGLQAPAGPDHQALQWAQHWRATSPAVTGVMRDFSGMGSRTVLTLLTLAVMGYLALTHRGRQSLAVGLSMATAALAVAGLKHGFDRARPDTALAAFVQDGLSFPSTHASMSMVFYLTVGIVLARSHERPRTRAYVVGVAALLAALIGFSRVVLGVHWASDVLGGWAFGVAWTLFWCWALPPDRPGLTQH